APRDVYFEELKGQKRKDELKHLFVGSGSFMNAPENSVNTLIVDEAPRLTEKTGLLKMGDNQIREILKTSISSIFFIDEDQRVSVQDYGESWVIETMAREMGMSVQKLALESQFRCNGSDGYLAWVDHALQIRETANYTLTSFDQDFEFKIFDDPKELQQLIFEKNKISTTATMVAG